MGGDCQGRTERQGTSNQINQINLLLLQPFKTIQTGLFNIKPRNKDEERTHNKSNESATYTYL